MDKNKTMLFCAIIVSISLIISSFILSNALTSESMNISTNKNNFESSDVLNLNEAANYLGIGEIEVSNLADGNGVGAGIPYLKINNKYIFSKSGLDKWLGTSHTSINP